MELLPTHRSRDHAEGPFPAHGWAEARADGSLAVFRAVGPFNIEGVRSIARMTRALHATLPAGHVFGHLVLCAESMLAPLEAFAEFAAMQSHALERGTLSVGFAIVAGPKVEGRNIVGSLLGGQLLAKAGQFGIFDTEPEARAWLELRLAAHGASLPGAAPVGSPPAASSA